MHLSCSSWVEHSYGNGNICNYANFKIGKYDYADNGYVSTVNI